MRALAIDTSTPRGAVVLWEGNSCAAREQSLDPSQHAEKLLGLIERAIDSAGWTKSQLDLVACCIGPGSFTGVRVGLATAKGIALGLDRPIVGVGSLEAMAGAALQKESGTIVALLDAHKSEVFWGVYDAMGRRDGPGHIVAARIGEIFATLVDRSIVVVGEIAAGLGLSGVRVLRTPETDLPDAAEVARIGIAKLEGRGPDDLSLLEPVYVRPPDITAPRPR
jgi:tRNA threonylcarbamoyladenosine biosynthesis protein TsaB